MDYKIPREKSQWRDRDFSSRRGMGRFVPAEGYPVDYFAEFDYNCYNANKRVKHASQVCFSRTHA